MVKFKHERYSPGQEATLERIINKGAQKIKRVILEEEDMRINPRILRKLGSVASDLKNKYKIEIKPEKILKKALEILAVEQGALPEKLQERYADLVAKEIVDSLAPGEDFHQLLKEKVIELKKQRIDVDGQRVEETIRKLAA